MQLSFKWLRIITSTGVRHNIERNVKTISINSLL